MHLVIVGLSHKTAPIAIRERVAFSPQDQERALLKLRRRDEIKECLILSTCNRTEILGGFPGWLRVAGSSVGIYLRTKVDSKGRNR